MAKSKRNKFQSCFEWLKSLGGKVTARQQLFAAAKALIERTKVRPIMMSWYDINNSYTLNDLKSQIRSSIHMYYFYIGKSA